MRISFWDTYTPDTFFLLYPVSAGFFLNTFRRYPRRRCGNRFCSIDPIPRPRFMTPFSSESSVLSSIGNGNQTDVNEEDEKENNVTDLVVPMSLYFANLLEPTQLLLLKSPIPYPKHYTPYNL